jgi:Holliday junction resolvase
MVDIRQKGAAAERDICIRLNDTIMRAMKDSGMYSDIEIVAHKNTVQRNQNQTAVGGGDLTNTIGLSIEIKRQEALAINTWWKQTVAAAERNNETPVLIYRQSKQKWRAISLALLSLQDDTAVEVRVEFEFEDFLNWFYQRARVHIAEGRIFRK